MAVTWKKLAYETDVITKALLTTKGDILYASAAATPARLGIGADNTILTVATDVPNWEAPAAAAAHKDTHDPEDGTDQLDTAAAGEIAGVAAAAEGTSHSFARADHTHQVQESMADNHIVTVNAADAAENDMARFSATGGLNGVTYAELAALLDLGAIGAASSDVDFNLQQAKDLVVKTVANEAALPVADIAAGELCWATGELSLHICTVAA
jgi:hypothetical protein